MHLTAAATSLALFLASNCATGATPTGRDIYEATCKACHESGIADAPRLGDRRRWRPLIPEGLKELTQDVIRRKGAMPPKGGRSELSRAEISRAIVFMANQARR
jgi:cytochrome c5